MGVLKVMAGDVIHFTSKRKVKFFADVFFGGLVAALIVSAGIIIIFALLATIVLVTGIQMVDTNISFIIGLSKILAGCLAYSIIYWVANAWHRSRALLN